MKKKAVVVSFFNSSNLGDLALSLAIENLVKKNGYEIIKYDFPTTSKIGNNIEETTFNETILITNFFRNKLGKIRRSLNRSIGPLKVEKVNYYLNIHFFKKWKVFSVDLKSADVLILAGGNMVMDISKELAIPNWSTIFHTYSKLAKKYNKPLIVSFIGAGPINYEFNKRTFGKALNYAKKISVRDSLSVDVCNEISPNKKILQTVDPVFSLEIFKSEERIQLLDNTSVYKVGVCILGEHCFPSLEEYQLYVKDILKFIINFEKHIPKNIKKEFLLFSTETADYQSVEEVYSKLSLESDINAAIIKVNKFDDIVELYGQLNFLMGGRMHSLIFAQICLLPYIGVIWQDKLTGFAKVTDSEKYLFNIKEIYEKDSVFYKNLYSLSINPKTFIDMEVTNKKLRDVVNKETF
ncbi:polysaccharide pyruvyl transferase family protein [Planococcus sp. SE5232]|uniref:polysaccharide pyruvyl transferase family protein n=1 Tax=unclassified Planococcus (in: firmicutes) TaxID=2662419 RepID=UPI003D6A0F6B